MNDSFFKFPSTLHLAVPDDIDIRDDKVISESERSIFLQHKLVIEEKKDGANLGISFDASGNIRAQNRGSYLQLPGSGQWKKLEEWLIPRAESLLDELGDRYMIFGEWCYAQHLIFYNCLPDWFLGFDVYDKQAARFLASDYRDKFFKKIKISQVPIVARGYFTLREIKKLLAQS